MTGSGKTGLGVIFFGEALRNNIPTLVIDPKGDMTNLLLTFPDLSADEFEPWIDASAAVREGETVEQVAADEAAKWNKRFGWWGLDGDDIKVEDKRVVWVRKRVAFHENPRATEAWGSHSQSEPADRKPEPSCAATPSLAREFRSWGGGGDRELAFRVGGFAHE